MSTTQPPLNSISPTPGKFPSLVILKQASVTRPGHTLLSDISWELKPGQNWIVVGPNGAGKSSFLKLVRGDLWPDNDGRGIRLYQDGSNFRHEPLGFKDNTALISPELQDTYRRLRLHVPAWQVVLGGISQSLRPTTRPSRADKSLALAALVRAGAGHLTQADFLSLSRGEARRVLIARALILNPRILFLDEPCAGLDEAGRGELLRLLDSLAQTGLQCLMATHRPMERPLAATHLLALEKGGITWQGELKDFQGLGLNKPSHPKTAAKPKITESVSKRPRDILVRLRHVSVIFNNRRALSDIDWEIRTHEHWGILGPNGAGKSTLLKVIIGQAQAYAGGLVERFLGLPDLDLREVRKIMGLVAPELQAGLNPRLTALETVGTGFFASELLPAGDLPYKFQRQADQLLNDLGLSDLADIPLGRLSYGQVRQILLARALVHRPKLLLLDEPLSGLDQEHRPMFAALIEKACGQGATLVMTTHHPQELPKAVTHVLRLEHGRIKAQGPKEKMV